MINDKTILIQLKETSKYMMGFVIITKNNNAIVIDGGRREDMPHLKECIGGRHISAWILTHAHNDHISGLVEEYKINNAMDFDIERIYYNFPPLSLLEVHDVPNYEYHREEMLEMLPDFNAVLPKFKEKAQIVNQGDNLKVDEVNIDFIYSYHEGLYANIMNDSSLVFKVTTENKTVLFLGDIGPDAGDVLFRESRHLLKSDIVQMAHHGHMNPSLEVYAEIDPEVCLWCCPDWLYNEPIIPKYLSDGEKLFKTGRIRMYGTALTRRWMDILGVKEHYVSKDGPNYITI